MTPTTLRRGGILAGLIAVSAAVAAACPVCYGAPDSPSAQGMTAAIVSLLGVTGGVLAAFTAMFLRLRARARQIAGKETPLHG